MNSIFHILNSSQPSRAAVAEYFHKEPASNHCWVDRESHPTHLETIIEWALLNGHRQLAIWGGDGTFSRAIQALYFFGKLEEVQLLLVPSGTANDFARKLGCRDWRLVIDGFLKNRMVVRRFDLGLLNTGKRDRIFLNNAGFGRVRQALARRRQNPIKDIMSFSDKELNVEWSSAALKGSLTCRGLLGIIFNAPFFNNGMYFAKDVEPTDGLLNMFIVPPKSRFKLLFTFMKSRFGRSLADAATLRFDGESISLKSDQDLFPQVDGEPLSGNAVREIRYSVKKGALQLFVIPAKVGIQI